MMPRRRSVEPVRAWTAELSPTCQMFILPTGSVTLVRGREAYVLSDREAQRFCEAYGRAIGEETPQ
jgi:hypothetical protein